MKTLTLTPVLRLIRAGRIGALVALAALGCRTPPDLRPFSEATSQLAASIKTSGRMTADEMAWVTRDWPEDQREQYLAISKEFETQWAGRNALADALVQYSASLTAIAQAGEQGAQSATQLAESFGKLTKAIDIALPPAEVVNGAVKLGSVLYGKFAMDYAAKTLGEGMQQMQPAIEETAATLAHSLENIELALDAVRDQAPANVNDEVVDASKLDGAPEEGKLLVRTLRDTLGQLQTRQRVLVSQLEQASRRRDGLRTALLQNADELDALGVQLHDMSKADTPDTTRERSEIAAKVTAADNEAARLRTDLAEATAFVTGISEDLDALLTAIESVSHKLAPFDERNAADRLRLSTEIELVRTARAGLTNWAAVHSRLGAAALQKAPLQVDDLVQTATDIRDLIKTIRDTPKE